MSIVDIDVYATLQVDPLDTVETIKESYRRLIIRYHPDKCQEPTSNEMFIKIQEAYEIVSDPSRREAYDKECKLNRKSIASENVSFSELKEITANSFQKTCRCGDFFKVSLDDIADGYNTFQCSGCSIYITIVDIP